MAKAVALMSIPKDRKSRPKKLSEKERQQMARAEGRYGINFGPGRLGKVNA